MKKGWMILLLVSLGLNLGLVSRLVRPGQEQALRGAGGKHHESRRWERPAPGDSVAWHKFMGRRIDFLTERLDLSPEQVDYFQGAHSRKNHGVRDKRQGLARIRTQMEELMAAEIIDRAAVRLAMAEMGRRQAEMDSLAAETVMGELEILNPDQRVRYLDFLPKGSSHHGGRGRRGGKLMGQ